MTVSEHMEELEERLGGLRGEIDTIDAEICALLKRRMRCSRGISLCKQGIGKAISDPARESAVIERAVAILGEEYRQLVERVWSEIFAQSRQLQVPCGLLGRKLSHSYSPQIHSMLGDYPYMLFEKEPEEVPEFLRGGGYRALNVTIPYKITAMDYCDRISEEALEIGCVNTLVRRDDSTVDGYNTDAMGFRYMMERAGIETAGRKCIVLGSGGASRTVRHVLTRMGAGSITVISRSGDDNYENISRHQDAQVIVNTTPVGMYPDTLRAPVDLGLFRNLEAVADLIYNPSETVLLRQARELGVRSANGLSMLTAQAKYASDLFLGVSRDDSIIDSITATMESSGLSGNTDRI